MQTKKRAKSVSFGKKKEKSEEKISHEVVQEILANAAKASSSEEKVAEPKEESPSPSEPTATTTETDTEKKEAPKSESEEKTETPDVTKIEEVVVETVSVSEQSEPEESGSNDADAKVTSTESSDESAEKSSLEASLETLKTDTEKEDLSGTSFFAQTPSAKPASRKKKGNLLYFFAVAFVSFILGLAVMAGATYGVKAFPNLKLDNWLAAAQPTPTPTKAPEPTPTPEKKVDLSEYKIQVLNGSGISGKAAKLKAALEEAGFTVSTTGNADASDYTKTQIRPKKNVSEDFLNKLEATLKKDYAVAATPGTPPTGTADVIVIIGSEEAK